MNLSGRYWPFRPSPLPDELLSSWLLRLSRGNAPATKSRVFFNANWPGIPLWDRDIDRSVCGSVIESLARKSGTPLPKVQQTLLRSYEGYAFENLKVGGHSRWVRPLGRGQARKLLSGMRFCPVCLCEDETPYYRKVWRMSFTSTCSVHKIILSDKCPECQSPCVLGNGDLYECHTCKLDLASTPSTHGEAIAISADTFMTELAKDGVTGLSSSPFMHSILLFDTWYQIISLLAYGPRSRQLRELTAQRFGGDPRPIEQSHQQNRSLDSLSSIDLHRLKGLAARLMIDFPNRLVELCAESTNWHHIVLKNMKPSRYALTTAARENLYQH